MKKRGQITLFIIIGIITLIATSLVFYFNNITREVVVPPPPADIIDLVNYANFCLEDVGTNAVISLGQQGGYIYFPDSIDFNPWSHIELIPESGIKLPYWYYRGQNRWPSKAKMEEDISRYVVENVERCINNFSDFQQFAYDKTDTIAVETEFTKNDVVIRLSFPAEFTNLADGKVSEYSKYLVHIPAKVLKAYDLAKRILKAENDDMFLEQAVLNLMVLDPEIPFSDLRFTCDKLRWSKGEVANELKKMLLMNVQRFRVKNTQFRPFQNPIKDYERYDNWDRFAVKDLEFRNLPGDLPSDMYEYKQLYFDVGVGKEFRNMEVKFEYDPAWSLDLEARPSRGDRMAAKTGKGFSKYMRFLCLNPYHFTYDVNVPIEIIVSDVNAFRGEGYNFRYATPVLIDHNQGNRQSTRIYDLIPKEENPEFCADLDPDKKVIVRARDYYLRDSLKDVNISFECGNFLCPYGNIELEGLRLQKTIILPQGCSPGQILATKPGWLDQRETVNLPEDDRVIVYMYALKDLKLDFSVYKNGDTLTPYLVGENQRITMSLYDIRNDYEVYKDRDMKNPDSKAYGESLILTLPVKDANYELNIALTEIVDGEEVLLGGYRADNWSISLDDVDVAKGITFGLYEQVPKPFDSANQIAMYTALESNLIKQKLTPRVSTR